MTADLPAPFSANLPGPSPALPAQGYATAPSGRQITVLNGRQKAAILVRLLLVEGADLNLAALPEAMQAELTEQMAQMRLVDRDTLHAVVAEFVETLEQVGLSFPDGIEGALKALSGKLSPGAAGRLRQIARARGHADPWDRIAATEPEVLIDLLAPESIEVAAVVLSKLPVGKAAELLGRMTGDRARRVAFAVASTEQIAPEAVIRIGGALAAELDRRPPAAFAAKPAVRVGAILNSVASDLRDSLLEGLEQADAGFAEGVRRAIFTFGHIAERLQAVDVPKILRGLDQATLVTALAHALPQAGTRQARSAEFLLANMSQRMAAALRDEIEGRGPVKPRDGEAAGTEVVNQIRALVDAGEITLRDADEDG
jgi:flagellar motor switch protein FliG